MGERLDSRCAPLNHPHRGALLSPRTPTRQGSHSDTCQPLALDPRPGSHHKKSAIASVTFSPAVLSEANHPASYGYSQAGDHRGAILALGPRHRRKGGIFKHTHTNTHQPLLLANGCSPLNGSPRERVCPPPPLTYQKGSKHLDGSTNRFLASGENHQGHG